MPAGKLLLLGFFTLMIMSSMALQGTFGASSEAGLRPVQSSTPVSRLDQALNWLLVNQPSNGSYGNYEEHWTAAAAYALWLNNTNSANAAQSYSYLAAQMNDFSTWFWGTYGEADVPGAILYSIASSSNLGLITNRTAVATELAQFQQSNGGFSGYYDLGLGQTVTSSVDTDMALLGLTASNLDPSATSSAVQYLLSLQNPDGSFNLTSTTNHDPIYSLGPDMVSITALTLLALKNAGSTIPSAPILSAIRFLSIADATNLCANGHVYSAALSALAFRSFNQPYQAIDSMFYIESQQNPDGGFSDSSRSSYPQSNALDTGWAAYALKSEFAIQGLGYKPSNCPPTAAFTVSSHTPVIGQSVLFNATTSDDMDQDQLTYAWTFGDGTSGHGVSPIHVYTQTGNFTVTLTATDSGSDPGPLSDTVSQTVLVQQATIQKSPTLSFERGYLLFLVAVLGVSAVAIVSIAFYLGRKSATTVQKPI